MTPTSIAMYVAIPRPEAWLDGCVAWIDSADRQCRKPRVVGLLCTRHHNAAIRRMEKQAEKEKAQAARRSAYREKNLATWTARLSAVEAELSRRTSPVTTDRAAFGGATHPSIDRKRLAQLSDSNVSRVGELIRERVDLIWKIGTQIDKHNKEQA